MRAGRRLWELAGRHHCVLLGAAFDVRELRQAFRRAGSRDWREAGAYELHSSAVHFAASRNAFSELVHKLLDERFRDALLPLKEANAAGLLEYWRLCAAGGEAVAAYWAALTHPACDAATEEALLQEMHMDAHQACTERRAGARRIRTLQGRVEELEGALAGARERASALQREAARLRGEALAAQGLQRETSRLREAAEAELARLLAIDERPALRAEISLLHAACAAARGEAEASRRALREAMRRIAALERPTAPAPIQPEPAAHGATPADADLAQRRVLCVGGKTNLVSQYRAVVEGARGEFAHHDGGVEHHLSRLPALLGAADAVVCLAGDCSHSAYRLAKRYCKAKGKPCALLGNSSIHALTRCLAQFQPQAA